MPILECWNGEMTSTSSAEVLAPIRLLKCSRWRAVTTRAWHVFDFTSLGLILETKKIRENRWKQIGSLDFSRFPINLFPSIFDWDLLIKLQPGCRAMASLGMTNWTVSELKSPTQWSGSNWEHDDGSRLVTDCGSRSGSTCVKELRLLAFQRSFVHLCSACLQRSLCQLRDRCEAYTEVVGLSWRS